MKVICQAAMAAKQPLERFQYEARPVGESEVLVSITHCGICYSDVHMIDNDAGISTYPFVPGHEIVGEVAEVGKRVTWLTVGRRVGIGMQARSCGQCEWCLRGEESRCQESWKSFTWSPYGGFAVSIIVDGKFAIPIPDALPSETAACLMCGGISVYTPIREHVRPGRRVAVAGIGGLGHLALQFARGCGAEVTALSSSASKEKDALALGAQSFVDLSRKDALAGLARAFDLILCTFTSGAVNFDALMATQRPGGRLHVLGFPKPIGPICAHPLAMAWGHQTLSSSAVGGSGAIREMLDFAARNKITARTEVFQLAKVNDAVARLRANKARYRLVLAN